jgi:hypothetical protein
MSYDFDTRSSSVTRWDTKELLPYDRHRQGSQASFPAKYLSTFESFMETSASFLAAEVYIPFCEEKKTAPVL